MTGYGREKRDAMLKVRMSAQELEDLDRLAGSLKLDRSATIRAALRLAEHARWMLRVPSA